MGRTDNQIVGLCRFSYLGEGGFRAGAQSLEQAAVILYDPARMQRRFAYFEQICLPSLAAQTDMGFKLVVLIGDTMPIQWRKRLKALAEQFAFVQICMLEATGPLHSTRRAFRRGWDRASTYLTGFRIDDDDAVAIDFISRTRQVADQLLNVGWADADTPAAVCFYRGLYWDMGGAPDTQFWDYRETEPLGLAAALIGTPDRQENIYRWNHRKLARYVPCWTDPTEHMFIRTLHGHNDSNRRLPSGAEPLSAPRADRLLADRFGLDPSGLRDSMARLQAEGA